VGQRLQRAVAGGDPHGLNGGNILRMSSDQPELPGMPPRPEPTFPQIDTSRPRSSEQYTVVAEIKLDDDIPFTGLSRERHNQLANEKLYKQMRQNREFRQVLESEYPGLFQVVSPGRGGSYPRSSPTDLGLTWHHSTMIHGPTGYNRSPGIMQLVPRTHHQSAGAVQRLLHPLPNGGGGFEQWG